MYITLYKNITKYLYICILLLRQKLHSSDKFTPSRGEAVLGVVRGRNEHRFPPVVHSVINLSSSGADPALVITWALSPKISASLSIGWSWCIPLEEWNAKFLESWETTI
jgi:hypothetical protein